MESFSRFSPEKATHSLPAMPSFAQVVKNQLENSPREPLTWSEASASNTAMASPQATVASDQRPASAQQPDDVEKHPILKLLQRDTADEGKRVEKSVAAVIVSELELQNILSSKDSIISALQQENANLKSMLEKQQTEYEDTLHCMYDRRIKTDKGRRDAIRRGDEFKVSLTAEKQKVKRAENLLALEREETSKLQAALLNMEGDLEEQRRQWEKEKILLTKNQDTSEVEQLKLQLDEEKNKTRNAENCLAKQREETSDLQAALVKLQSALEEQRREWKEEQSHLKTIQQERDEMKNQFEFQKQEAEQEIAALQLEQQKMKQFHQDAARKVIVLEISLSAEKNRTKQTEISLAKQVQETCKLQAALVKVEEDVDKQRLLWAREKSTLLTEQQKTVGNAEAATKHALEVLAHERQEWQTEKSHLLEIIETTKESLREMEVERDTSTESLMDKIRHLQQELNNSQERKPKKKSLRKRLAGFFKGSKKAPAQSENGPLSA